MAKIEVYDAGIQRLALEERGSDAATRAGRYVGQYRRQEAEDIKAGGVLQAQGIRQRGWPFDILALLEGRGSGGGSGRGGRGGSGGGGEGGGVKSNGGDSDPFGFAKHLADSGHQHNQEGYTPGYGFKPNPIAEHHQEKSGGKEKSESGGGGGHSSGGRGEKDKGAPSREEVNPDGSRVKYYRDGSHDTVSADGTTRRYDTDGNARTHGQTSRGAGTMGYTLEKGQFVRSDKDPMLGENAAAAKSAEATAQYWNRWNGGHIPSGTEDPVDEFGVPKVQTDPYGNPFTSQGGNDTQGYQPPPPIPGEEYSRENYEAPQPEVGSLRNWITYDKEGNYVPGGSEIVGGDYGGGGNSTPSREQGYDEEEQF